MSIQIRVAGLVASAIVASAASAQTAVEWKVSEGGNGHWYALVAADYSLTWPQLNAHWAQRGAHLCTITSAAENAWVAARMVINPPGDGALLGGYVAQGGAGSVGWTWITGEPWSFELWATGAPGGPANEHYVYMTDQFHWGAPSGYWDDCPWGYGGSPMAVIEWDADCNNDGIVDYGQIKSGQLADDNTNGIPDICETSITGVLPPSVPAQGGSTITINGRNFPAQPSLLVGGVAATNVVRISDSRLTAVTPPLLPGMAPLTVNGYTLPDAIYIRPECGSDLDQNGTVDAGDISIILLDFGPCYEPPAALTAPAPTPLLADEPAQKTGTAEKE